jgi:hypothetical protein
LVVTFVKSDGTTLAAFGGAYTEVSNGIYRIEPVTADVNTLGGGMFRITGTKTNNADAVDQYIPFLVKPIRVSSGPGATEVTLTITDDGDVPIADADVWITSDLAGNVVVTGTKQTDTSGQVVFYLDTGVAYYRWSQKDGKVFTNPQIFTPS